MRLMNIDTKSYTLYRPDTEQSSRAGSKFVYLPYGSVTGQLSFVHDSVTLEMYGNRADKMATLICENDTDIRLKDKIQDNDTYYVVISVQRFTTHVTATLEITEVL